MQNRLPAIISILLALIAGAWLWFEASQPPTPDNSATGQRLFPTLEQQLNDVDRILIEHNGSVYEVLKNGAQWQLPDKGDYPVLFERVKPLLLGIALLDKVEPKTSKPENHARLGVQEPNTDSDNMRISLYSNGDKPVASLIIGGIRGGLIAGGKDGIYARVSGDAQAWLVAGNLDLPHKQVDWIDRQIVHIKPKAVKRVAIRHPDGTDLTLEKQYKSAVNFSVLNMPAGSEPIDPAASNLLARSLAALDLDDVRVRPPDAPSGAEGVTAVFSTWDGLAVKVTTIEQHQQIWAWFDLIESGPSDTDDLQTRFSGWIYQLPPSRAAKLRARPGDLRETVISD